MLQGVPIHLTRTGEQKPCPNSLGKSQHIKSTHHIGLNGLDWVILIMNRGGRAGQVVDLIDLQQNRLNDVMPNELEPRVPKMVHQIILPPGKEIINHNHVVAPVKELVNKMRPNEPSTAGDDNSEPPLAEPDGDPTHLGMGGLGDEVMGGGEGSGDGGGGVVGVRWAEAVEGGLEDEEGGADENANEDEEEPLFFEEVVDGSGERSRVFESLGRVG